MHPITQSAFFDELNKIAKLDPAKMQKLLADIGASAGKFGKSQVPKSRRMTLSIGKTGVTRMPLPPGA